MTEIVITINSVLELVNGNLTILRAVIFIGLTYYIWRQSRHLRMTGHDWMFAVPAEIALAASFLLNDGAEMMRNGIVWFWRYNSQGSGPLADPTLIWLSAAGAVSVVSLLWVLRVVTRPWMGEWPWIITGWACFIYTLVTLLT